MGKIAQTLAEIDNSKGENMEDVHSDEDYILWLLMAQLRRAMLKARKKELAKYRLTPERGRVLLVAQAAGSDATPGTIARWLVMEPHSISEYVATMEKQGLVKKIDNVKRTNSVIVVLTEKGRKAYEQAAKLECVHRIMACLSGKQRQQLKLILWTLRDFAVKDIGIKDKLPYPPHVGTQPNRPL